MSENEHWLLVFMALGANLKISIFDPPSVGGTYDIDDIHIYRHHLASLDWIIIDCHSA